MTSHAFSGSLHPRRHGEIAASSVIRKAPNQNINPRLPPIDDYDEDPEIEEDGSITEHFNESSEAVIEEEEDEENYNNYNNYNNKKRFSENNNSEIYEEEEEEELENNKVKKKKLQEMRKKHIREIDGMCKDLNESTQDFEDGRDSIIEKVQNENSMSLSLTDSLSAEISPIDLLNAQLKIETQKSEKLEQILHDERERIAKLEEMLHEELEKNDKMQIDLNKANETIDDLKDKLDKADLKNGVGILREENSSLMDQIEELQAELNKKQKRQGTDKVESELKHAKEQLVIKDSRIEQLNNKNQNLSNENNKLQDQIEDLLRKLENSQKDNKSHVSAPSSSSSAAHPPTAAPNHLRKPTRPADGYDPKRFGFKPRPTSAEDHVTPTRIPRFPKREKNCSDDDVAEKQKQHPAPIVKKPKDDKNHQSRDSGENQPGIVKRPKLGALKEPNENENEDDFVEDKLPIKINKVEVAFGDLDDEEILPKPENPRKPAPRRAMVDNIKFGCDDDDNNTNNKAKGKPQNSSQAPAPISAVKIQDNKKAMADNIKFGNNDDDEHNENRKIVQQPQRPRALESQISFNQPDSREIQSRPQIAQSGMSVNELQAKVDKLNIEKAEIERQLNKALPKGKIMTHIRKEREDLEDHLDDVMKDISKLKLELKFADHK